MQVGAVGDHGAHAEGQGEEHLACRSLEDLEEVFLERLEVPAEHELVAAACTGLACDIDDDDEKHDEQSRHTDLAELLDALRDACRDYQSVQCDEDCSPEYHLTTIHDEGAEVIGDVGNAPGVP